MMRQVAKFDEGMLSQLHELFHQVDYSSSLVVKNEAAAAAAVVVVVVVVEIKTERRFAK